MAVKNQELVLEQSLAPDESKIENHQLYPLQQIPNHVKAAETQVPGEEQPPNENKAVDHQLYPLQ